MIFNMSNFELKTDIPDSCFTSLSEAVRNIVKTEVTKAIAQVDMKTIIKKAINDATVNLKIKTYEVEQDTVKHYSIVKEVVKVPEIVWVPTPIKQYVWKGDGKLIEEPK